MKKKILIAQPINENGLNLLKDFDVRIASDSLPETIKHEINGVHGLIVRDARITKEIITAADKLEVIGRHGVGIDNIDIQAATEKGILVVNTLDANALSVAEHTVVVIGALAKRVVYMNQAVKNGYWEARNEYQSYDLDRKILGVIGMGRIGRLVAGKARTAYNMNIMAFDPYYRPLPGDDYVISSSLEEIFRQADIITLHVPITPETRKMVNKSLIGLMKQTAYLVNFSRGEIVDEEVLCNALQNKRIAGAALDVYVKEPLPANSPLMRLDNVLLSPHSAALTKECIVRMATSVAQGVGDYLNGRRPKFPVNPEILEI